MGKEAGVERSEAWCDRANTRKGSTETSLRSVTGERCFEPGGAKINTQQEARCSAGKRRRGARQKTGGEKLNRQQEA
jgi:hypothetical protein